MRLHLKSQANLLYQRSLSNQPETNIKDSKQTVIYVIIGAVVILGIMLVLGATLYAKNKNNDENED